jgi:hypothetical protein
VLEYLCTWIKGSKRVVVGMLMHVGGTLSQSKPREVRTPGEIPRCKFYSARLVSSSKFLRDIRESGAIVIVPIATRYVKRGPVFWHMAFTTAGLCMWNWMNRSPSAPSRLNLREQ